MINKMKKIFISTIACTITISLLSINIFAFEKKETSGTIDIQEIIQNPQNYPEIELIVQTPYEYIESIKDDEFLNAREKERLINDAQRSLMNRAASYSYIKISRTVTVTNSYSCYPYFRFKTETQGGIPAFFVELTNANIDRNYNGISKQFKGTLKCNLESKTKFYWDLNGDFFNNGTTTGSFEGSAGIAEVVNIKFAASYATNWYAYKQYDEVYTLRVR